MAFNWGSLLTVLHFYYSLCLLPECDDFRSRLEKSLPLFDKSTHPNTGDMAIDAVLEVLQTERERKGVMAVEKTDNRDEMDDGASTAVMDQGENIVEEVDQPQAPVDNALKILVHNATEEFCFAPRDVYNGVLELPNTRKQYVTAMEKLDCSELKAIVETLYGSRKLDDFSARVVVVHPLQISASHDWWVIDFKSIRIAREVAELMRLEDVEHLQEAHGRIHKLSEGSPLAGWVFKATVYRMLSDGSWSGGSMPQPIQMVSDGHDPPTFSTNSSSSPSAPEASLPPPAPLRAGTRTII